MTLKAFQLAAILGTAAPGSEPALLTGWSRGNGRPRSPADHAARASPLGASLTAALIRTRSPNDS